LSLNVSFPSLLARLLSTAVVHPRFFPLDIIKRIFSPGKNAFSAANRVKNLQQNKFYVQFN